MMKKTLAILVLALAVPVGALAAGPSAVNGPSTFKTGGTVAGASAFSAANGRGAGHGYDGGFGRPVMAGVLSATTNTNSSTATSTSTVTTTRG
ncbi:hypothetical protein [Dickeya dadantii]|nr:hypothetical protein [Dickeya dadantii]